MNRSTAAPSSADLMTIREVAEVLRVRPETLSRWAREGRLPAVKVGKEWRVRLADMERLLGRTVPRPRVAYAPPHPPGSPPEPASLERDLLAFLRPRDRLLALGEDRSSLAAVQVAFWRLAVSAGGPLRLLRPQRRTKAARARLARAGIVGQAGDPEAVLTAADDSAAREAVSRTIRADAGVWACFGALDDLAPDPERAERHARALAAISLTGELVSLTGMLADRWQTWPLGGRVRVLVAHRGLIYAAPGEVHFARIN
jgi:excisionase family DNA binding protein